MPKTVAELERLGVRSWALPWTAGKGGQFQSTIRREAVAASALAARQRHL